MGLVRPYAIASGSGAMDRALPRAALRYEDILRSLDQRFRWGW
jgi:hypothetical protein